MSIARTSWISRERRVVDGHERSIDDGRRRMTDGEGTIGFERAIRGNE